MSDCEEQVYEGSFPREDGIIRYGDHVQLRHVPTGRYVSTDDETYDGGSGQQRVFASESNISTWQVLHISGSNEQLGYEVGWDDELLLRPLNFPDYRLHSSPGVESLCTAQQEVSCFAEKDMNDVWTVARASEDTQDNFWRVGEGFYLFHRNSGVSLHSHEFPYDDGENEVTGFPELDENSIFVI
ncbi:hypothetical protein BC941DRAFT_412523 [Chlamydoabsidia padenii]|nr:hypothetical protein BC941DRAFT_412523 [Chlamydoabsidia padenii]